MAKELVFGTGRLDLKDNLDVSVYAKENYNSKQIKTIRKYLKDKVNISTYVENNFTQHQIKQTDTINLLKSNKISRIYITFLHLYFK